MSDPARYLRQAYVVALRPTVLIYDTIAPKGAALPYGVIRVSYAQDSVKESAMYRCTVTLQLYSEAQEYNSQLALDEIGDEVIAQMVKHNGANYLTVTGFDHVTAKVISVLNGFEENDAVTVMTKTFVIEHLLDTQ